jgi:hypothetical protein
MSDFDYDAEVLRAEANGYWRLVEPFVKEIDRLRADIAILDNVVIPSWQREEDMWRQDEEDAVEFRRVLAEELDKKDADITRLRAWLRDRQPTAQPSATGRSYRCECGAVLHV